MREGVDDRVPRGGSLGDHDRKLGGVRRDEVGAPGDAGDGEDGVRDPRDDEQRHRAERDFGQLEKGAVGVVSTTSEESMGSVTS